MGECSKEIFFDLIYRLSLISFANLSLYLWNLRNLTQIAKRNKIAWKGLPDTK